jgi:hypothetical protein|tara:strand:+ start:460 stop:639 length:180 start_codon:yes stop_codon:yes gene_type:complete
MPGHKKALKKVAKVGINQARQLAVKQAKKKAPKITKAVQKNKALKKVSRRGMKKLMSFV